jgi:hypothetical protein
MNAFRTFAVLSVAILGLIGCSTTKPIRNLNPESHELNGDVYYLILKNGNEYRVHSLSVKKDSVYFKGNVVHVNQVKRIETRSFSVPKTVGLVVGIWTIASVAGFAYLLYLFNETMSSE